MKTWLVLLLVPFSIFSELRTIRSLEEISLQDFSEKTLVMFDIDDVLIYPKDALLQNWRSEWKPTGIRTWTAEEDTIAWMNAAFQLMDPLGPELVRSLQDSGIPTIGFTAFMMEQPGILKSIPEWRNICLKALGLDFRMEREVTFPLEKGVVPSSFEKGVLYCGDSYRQDKEHVFSQFLDWLDWMPEKVVFIDDSKKNLDRIAFVLDERGIPFLGFHYIPKDLDEIDEEVAILQHQTVIDQRIWLSDRQAKNIINS